MQRQCDQIMIFGDFNMTSLDWKFEEDSPGHLITSNIHIPAVETMFVNFLNERAFFQLNHIKNSVEKLLT